MFEGLKIPLSGMLAQRIRFNLIASNIANINSKYPDGTPYRRKLPVFETVVTKLLDETYYSVKVSRITEDPSPYITRYEPSNPNADQNGYIKLPNIDPVREMSDMLSAIRSYEANLTAFNTYKSLMLNTIDILKI